MHGVARSENPGNRCGIMIVRIAKHLLFCFKAMKRTQEKYAETLDEIAENYPRFYSERRFCEWRALFHPIAVVGRTGPDGRTRVVSVDQTAESSQRLAERSNKWHERWADVKTYLFGNVAVMCADYCLEHDTSVITGQDVLLLMHGKGGWRIMALAYDERIRDGVKL